MKRVLEQITLEDERYDGVRETIKMLPQVPGVYVFKNDKKKIIYIGKAKNLKKRVQSYFINIERHPPKTKLLVKQIAFLDFVIVNTEEEAFLLENNLIKENQPKYNILLKDDKSYPWICITKEEYPRVFLTRNYNPKRGKYFGPYTSSSNIHGILKTLRALFLYRSCKLPLSEEQIEKKRYRSCLEYHIHNCKAPCIRAITKEEYQRDIECISSILNGKIGSVIATLTEEYTTAIEVLEFEEAEVLHHRIQELKEYQHKNSVLNPEVGDLDVITIVEKEKRIALNYMHVYNGAIVLSINKLIQNPLDSTLPVLLEVAISRLREEFGSEASHLLTNVESPLDSPLYKKIDIPKRGDKHRVLLLSQLNADRYLAQTSVRNALPEEETLIALQKLLELPRIPRRIECIDNSNTLGEYPVSAVVVFIDGVPAKEQYRIYNIKEVEGPNDYATMEEVIRRRFTSPLKAPLPDLLLIDGGKGQLSSVQQALQKITPPPDIPLAGLAERLEEIFVPRGTTPIVLDKGSPVLKLLIQLRDEAHRFGLRHHTQQRDSSVRQVDLLAIEGVGIRTVQKLYTEFGSLISMREAGKDAIGKCIGAAKAKIVWQYIQKEGEVE